MHKMGDEFTPNDVFLRDTQALFCLFRHGRSGKYLVVGNTHFFHDPAYDFVKHAQAIYLLKVASGFVRESLKRICLSDDEIIDREKNGIAFILAGDFNSLPISSVMSVFHNEDITSDNPSMWRVPVLADQEV
jgi:mRNA deadenylase 3'-5' endonuclease subunit Ccr4